MVKAGEAFVVVGTLKDKMVSAGFSCIVILIVFMDHLFLSDRCLKTIVSFINVDSNFRMQKNWLLKFDVGKKLYRNHTNNSNFSKKELRISDFKSGFGGQIEIALDIKLNF